MLQRNFLGLMIIHIHKTRAPPRAARGRRARAGRPRRRRAPAPPAPPRVFAVFRARERSEERDHGLSQNLAIRHALDCLSLFERV